MSEVVRLRADAVEWRAIDGEVLAVDLDRASYLAVNPSGALLWEALAHGTTRSDLVSGLMAAFGLDEDEATRDVDAFLDQMRERKLLADPAAA